MGVFGKIGPKSSKYASKKIGLVLKMGVYGIFGKIGPKSSKYAPRNIVIALKMRSPPLSRKIYLLTSILAFKKLETTQIKKNKKKLANFGQFWKFFSKTRFFGLWARTNFCIFFENGSIFPILWVPTRLWPILINFLKICEYWCGV